MPDNYRGRKALGVRQTHELVRDCIAWMDKPMHLDTAEIVEQINDCLQKGEKSVYADRLPAKDLGALKAPKLEERTVRRYKGPKDDPNDIWVHSPEDQDSARIILDVLSLVFGLSSGRKDFLTNDEATWCIHVKNLEPTMSPLGVYALARAYIRRVRSNRETTDLDMMLGMSANAFLNDPRNDPRGTPLYKDLDDEGHTESETYVPFPGLVLNLENYRRRWGRLSNFVYHIYSEKNWTMNWELIELVDRGGDARGLSMLGIRAALEKFDGEWMNAASVDIGLLRPNYQAGKWGAKKGDITAPDEPEEPQGMAKDSSGVYVSNPRNKEESEQLLGTSS